MLGCSGSLQGPTIHGSTWRAVSIAGLSPVPGSEPTLTLGPGEATGSAGCNGYASDRLIIDDRLLPLGGRARVWIEGLAMQAAPCRDPELMRVGQVFDETLGAVDHLHFDAAGRLVMTGWRGQLLFEPLR